MEKIIKSKERVQKHGEVFTPKKIVNQMLNVPEVRRACESLTSTFLEPSAGEGAFLIEILDRKLRIVAKKYNQSLTQYENYSLLALTTLYGIELLEDNAQLCTMNMYEKFLEHYQQQLKHHKGKINIEVLKSAKKIISLNIENGDFLTKKSIDNKPIVFNEWTPINFKDGVTTIKIQRTEYTLDEIIKKSSKESGKSIRKKRNNTKQLSIFNFLDEQETEESIERELIYLPVKIFEIYKEEMGEL